MTKYVIKFKTDTEPAPGQHDAPRAGGFRDASMGACATSTGVFHNYALIPVNQVIPIDVFVPGCPPRPEQLIYALMMLQEKIQGQSGTVRQVLNLS